MNERLRPTTEAIEAALSAYEPMADEETGQLSEDTKCFLNLVNQNETLRLEMVGLAAAIGATEASDPLDWQALAKSGKLTADLMFRVNILCDMFFWVGWHARGAIEDTEKMKRFQ